MNQFIRATQQKDTQTENGALSNSTTGSELVDQFGKAGSYRGRDIKTVWNDQAKLDNSGVIWAIRFVLYLRIVSRVIDFFGQFKTQTVQRGQGAKDESIKRFLWYAFCKSDTFIKYLPVFIACGSFRDLTTMHRIIRMNYKIFSDNIIDEVVKFYVSCILSENNAMALKYMPLVQSNKKCTTPEAIYRNQFARAIRDELGVNDREMRVLKSGGSGHVWQKLISQKRHTEVSFNHIPGRALFLMATSKFLTNQKLREKYTAWLATKPVAKFTGFVFELAQKISYDQVIRQTIDKQFKGLLETAGTMNRNWIVALDTSGSMGMPVKETGATALTIAKSMAVYFANMLQGTFHKTFIQFAVKSNLRTLGSAEFCDQFQEIEGGVGCTNFQSAIDCIVEVRRENEEIPLGDYPNGLIVVSDMQFDPSQGYVSGVDNQYGYRGSYQNWIKPAKTNYETAMQKLREVFPQEWVDDFKIVWWDCTARCADFPSVNEDSGTICISGFDGAMISNLFGMEQNTTEQKENNAKPSMEDIVKNTLSQEILLLVE